MNPAEILHNGEGTGIWRCGACGQYHKGVTAGGKPVSDMNRKSAERCCVCSECGDQIKEGGFASRCRSCLEKWREGMREERRRMIESGENIVTCEDCGTRYDCLKDYHEEKDCIAALKGRIAELEARVGEQAKL